MNYKEARNYLDEVTKYGSVLGLENMYEMLQRLGNPQNDLKFIHIAGTNGKGSVLAYLSAILKEAGYKVGRYISPTLFCYRERIQVNEAYIEKEALARLVTRIADVAEDLKAHPTAFEIETALGFLYFQEQNCDLVLLETGLGGLLDATNVVTTTVMEVMSSISMDHMGVLGNTLGEIAENKAGIIKPDTLVVTVEQKKEAMEVLLRVCRDLGCRMEVARFSKATDIIYDYEWQQFTYGGYRDIRISLAGAYQIENAVLAIEAAKGLMSLDYKISEEALRAGMESAAWKGRFTVLSKEPVFVIDGAHNRDAARMLQESIELYFADRKLYYIMGVFKDKEYEEIIRMTAPRAERIIAIETPDHDRALPAKELAKAIAKVNPHVETAENIRSAVEKSMAAAGKEDVILAFGSLSFLGEITKALDTVRR